MKAIFSANGLRLRPGQAFSNAAGVLGPGITGFRSPVEINTSNTDSL